MTAGTALVVLAPEAEPLAGPFRERYDPSAAAGCPAHITVLYPFKPPDAIDGAMIEGLRRCMAGFAPFRYALTAIRRFPGALYLAPEPDEPFRRLTLAVWGRHPEAPPYGGRHADIVPHLGIAQLADERHLDRIAADVARAAQDGMPIRAVAREVALLDGSSGRWQIRETFQLDGVSPPRSGVR